MADCDLVKGCIFFNDKMVNYPTTAGFLKKTYCQGDRSGCARYMVFKTLGREHVPTDLFPHNIDRARQLIASRP